MRISLFLIPALMITACGGEDNPSQAPPVPYTGPPAISALGVIPTTIDANIDSGHFVVILVVDYPYPEHNRLFVSLDDQLSNDDPLLFDGIGSLHALQCEFSTANKTTCAMHIWPFVDDGYFFPQITDLTNWLPALPQNAYLIAEACAEVTPPPDPVCISFAIPVEFQ